MREPKVSIIVTIHNSAVTLENCMKSVMNQRLRDIEILCIDGGSTDDSPEILRRLSADDNRIRIISDPVTGYGHKINRGIKEAAGKYIAILESDDQLKEDGIETLYQAAEENDCDYVDGDYDGIFFVDGQRYVMPICKYGNADIYGKLLDRHENLKYLGCASGAIWTGLYKISFLRKNGIELSETPGASYQDVSFAFLVTLLASSAYHLKKSVYFYWLDNGDSSTNDPKKVMAIIVEYDNLYEKLSQRKADSYIWDRYYHTKYSSYYWNICRLGLDNSLSFAEYYHDEVLRDEKEGHICRKTKDDIDYNITFLIIDDLGTFNKNVNYQYSVGLNELKLISRMISSLVGKDVVIFGCGIRGHGLLKLMKKYGISADCFCDNMQPNQKPDDIEIPIYKPEDAAAKYPKCVFAIPKGRYSTEMKEQLMEINVEKCRILEI